MISLKKTHGFQGSGEQASVVIKFTQMFQTTNQVVQYSVQSHRIINRGIQPYRTWQGLRNTYFFPSNPEYFLRRYGWI